MGTSDGQVFGSTDSGDPWNLLGRIGEHHDDVIMPVAIDPRSVDTIYAASWTLSSHGGGVYQSTDGGHNWQLLGLAGLVVRAIAIAPSHPETLVAGAADGVYRSEDSGNHWVRMDGPVTQGTLSALRSRDAGNQLVAASAASASADSIADSPAPER